jgi:tetratricopeptide (TPR) repeat protein/spermidine synthase
MLSPIARFTAALLTGLGIGTGLAAWARTAELLTADPRLVWYALGGASLAAAAGMALLGGGAARRRRPGLRSAGLVLLGGLALVAASFVSPAVHTAAAQLGLVLGVAALLLLPVPGMFLLGGVLSPGASGPTAGRSPAPFLPVIAGVGAGVVVHAVSASPPPHLLAAPFVLAALTAWFGSQRTALSSSLPTRDGDRVVGDGALVTGTALGLASGSAVTLGAALSHELLPPHFPAASLAAGAFLLALGVGGVIGGCLPAGATVRAILAALASGAAALLLRDTFGRSHPGESLSTHTGSTAVSALPDTLWWLGPGTVLLGLAIGLAWRAVRLVQARGLPRGMPVSLAAGAGLGGALTLGLLPLADRGAVWVLLPALVGASGGAVLIGMPSTARGRLPAAVGVAALLAALLVATRPSSAPAAPAQAVVSSLGPNGRVEVIGDLEDAPAAPVRLDGRLALGPATRAEERRTARLVALPLRLHGAPARALVLDEITGACTSAALRTPELAVECTWLEPALRRHFGPELAARARRAGRSLRQHAVGGRALLASRPGSYDVIVDLQPAGRTDLAVSGLTEGYFRIARRALRTGGLLCVWLPLDRVSAPETAGAVAAFLSAFPRSGAAWTPSLLFTRPIIGLIGTRDDTPVMADPDRRLGRPPEAPAEELRDLPGLLALRLAGAEALRRRFAARIPTDREPFLRHLASAAEPTDAARAAFDRFAELVSLPLPDPSSPPPNAVPPEAKAVAQDIRRLQLARFRARQRENASEMEPLLRAAEGARRALERTPDLGFVHCFVDDVARSLRASGLSAEARALYDRAAELAPDWGGAWLGKADFVFERRRRFRRPDDWKPLEDLAEKALARDERLARAWIYLGVANYYGNNDPASARGCLENAAKIDPDDPLLKSYLWHFIEQDGRPEEAAAMLLDACEAFPEEEQLREALLNLVPKLRLAGKAAQGLYVLQRLAGAYAEDARYFLTRAEILEVLGDMDGAIDAMGRCCRLAKPPVQGYYLHYYRLLRKVGRTREASETRDYFRSQFGVDPEELLSGS